MGKPRKPMTVTETVACAIGEKEGYSSITVMKQHFKGHALAAMNAGSLIGDALAKCGWIPHQGEACPVSHDSFPLVLCADGTTDCERASDFDWTWSDPQYPSSWVIAYRDERTL